MKSYAIRHTNIPKFVEHVERGINWDYPRIWMCNHLDDAKMYATEVGATMVRDAIVAGGHHEHLDLNVVEVTVTRTLA